MNFTLNPVLHEQLPQLARKIAVIYPDDIPASLLKCLNQNDHARILQELLQLLSQEFQKYIQGAITQDWPFLPPTINPTMMAEPNPEIPKLNQVELLLLCLNSAFDNEDYRMALSIAFVIDRFVYYCDGSAALLKIVDCIRKLSPSTPVAPQLVIRNARVMKDNGDLHGSIQILNSLIEEKWEDLSSCNSPSRWQYKEEQQYINVAAVCVQIKGQIYHNLSLWKEAIGPLMKSIEGFNRLSVKDYKGISYSYSLLSRCLCRLSKREYRNLRQEYSFQFDNHCYQAYEFGMLAYETCPGQRLFLSKHLLLSGECLLMYTVQLADGKLRHDMFLKILEILNLVFYKQNLEELSQSKDQLFNFIKSLFVTCLTFGCSANSFDRCMGNYLETICLFIYKKFCDIGANQLDSEIGKLNLKKIIPALTFSLITISQQHPNESGGEVNDGLTVADTLDKTTEDHFHASTDSTKDTSESVDQGKQFNRNLNAAVNAEQIVDVKAKKDPLSIMRDDAAERRFRALTKIYDAVDLMEEENIPMVDGELATRISGEIAEEEEEEEDYCEMEDVQLIVVKLKKGSRMLDYEVLSREWVVRPKKLPMVDCEAITQENIVMQEETPMVDCDAVTKERVVIQDKKLPMVDCEAITQEKVVMQERTTMVDCDAVTKKRVVIQDKKISMVDCEDVIQEGTPMVDCDAVTKKRVVIQDKKLPMVDCEAITQEKVVMQERITMVDCDAVTKKRVVIQDKKIPMVDCEAVTQEKVVMQERTTMVDCDAVTKKRVVIQDKKISMVDCEDVIQEGTPMVDCDAVTKKRVVIQNKKIPMVDCEDIIQEGTPMVDCDAVTQKRVVIQDKKIPMVDCEDVIQEGTPMVDCDAITQKKMVIQDKKIPMVDCEAVTQEKMVMQEGTPMVDCDAITQKRVVIQDKKIPMVDCAAVSQEKMVMQEGTPMVDSDAITQERVVILDKKIPMVDCEAVTQEKMVMQEGTPMVDCDAITQKRMVIQDKKIPMVDCEAVTQEKMVMQEGTPMVDCDAITQKRVVIQDKKIPMVDCEGVTQEKMVMQEGTPMVDSDAITQERVVILDKKIPMVDCEAVTQEKMVMQEGTPMVDCDAITQKRVVILDKKIPMVDCEAVTQEKMVMQEGTPMVDCDAITQKRVVIQDKKIPMVDCEAVTQEKMVMQEETPVIDCEAVTQERMVKKNRKVPLVDCKAVTQEREVMQQEEKETVIVDSEAVSQESSASFRSTFTTTDCTADTQKRVFDTDASLNVMSDFNFFSDLGNIGCSLPEEFWTLSVKPQRIVGLPSRISMIESKVSAVDNLCQTFEDFIVDHDSSLMPRSKDASLVNTKALTVICQSKKDGTYLLNRLLTKFQRQESFPEEPQLNKPITEDMNQVSLASFMGNLLRQNHDIVSSLLSETDFSLRFLNQKEDPDNQGESINKVQKATLYEYNPVTCVWSGQDTIVCTGKELTLGKGKKGQFRNVYQINYLHQEEPLGKYVSKRYRNQRESLQYMDDVVCQMQAGLYVNLFNQALKMFKLDLRIYFLNAAFMLLYDSQGEVEDWMNIEPFVNGEFIKLTSNYDFCDPRGKNVSTSFTHFTYVQSDCQMMVCDLQGWLPSGTQNLIYLTDPQFHTDSGDSSPFDFGQEGIKLFFDVVHPECNEICQTLKLKRPTF